MFASRHSVESYAAQVHLLTPMAPAGLSGYNREPELSPSHMNLWPEYGTASWTPPTFPNAAHSLVSDPMHMRHPDSMAETNANRDLQVASWRPTEARPIQGNTNAYNNGHIGNRVPIEHPFAEGIPVSIAGPNVSALPTDAQAAISNEVIMMRRGKLHGEGPHICKLDGKAFRHHGDLVRHRKTKPGHAEYQGPVVCVCGQEFSRRDGLYTHLKAKRCRRRPFFSR